MILELTDSGLRLDTEKPIAVYYDGRIVGTFSADLVVNEKVILELKAKEKIIEAHEAQLVNYLRATEIEVGLLLNFGRQPEFKRKYFSNRNKRVALETESRNLLESLFDKEPF